MNIKRLSAGRFISAHTGATVYRDSRHRLIKTKLEGGVIGELMQESRSIGFEFRDQYVLVGKEIIAL
jgi:hypothetical protein